VAKMPQIMLGGGCSLYNQLLLLYRLQRALQSAYDVQKGVNYSIRLSFKAIIAPSDGLIIHNFNDCSYLEYRRRPAVRNDDKPTCARLGQSAILTSRQLREDLCNVAVVPIGRQVVVSIAAAEIEDVVGTNEAFLGLG
jgi:hypothetical protein